MSSYQRLLHGLDRDRQVAIQAHDFPDHDAVGAAFALSELLINDGLRVSLSYGGAIQSASLAEEITTLKIPIHAVSEAGIEPDAQIIVVDGFVGNSNITGLPGTVFGVIDHHSPPTSPKTEFYDIREDVGSCCTIVYQYLKDAMPEANGRIATALLIGLMMDTGFMTRGVTAADLDSCAVGLYVCIACCAACFVLYTYVWEWCGVECADLGSVLW